MQKTVLLLLLLSATLTTCLSEPVYITVFNQENQTITDLCAVVAEGASPILVNSTHVYLNISKPTLVKIIVKSTTVYEFIAEPNHAYRLKVKVGRLVLKLPKYIKAEITILSSNYSIKIDSFEKNTIVVENVPYGLIKIKLIGATTEEYVCNFQGGVIEVKEKVSVKWLQLAPLLALSLIPLTIHVAYTRCKKNIEKKPVKTRPTAVKRSLALKRKSLIIKKSSPEKTIEKNIELKKHVRKPFLRKKKTRNKSEVLSIADLLNRIEY